MLEDIRSHHSQSTLRRLAACALMSFLALPALAQDSDKLRYGFEVKGHYRDSDLLRFKSPFNFPLNFLPPGETEGFLETTEPGEHTEISTVSLWLEASFWQNFEAKVKIDLIDRHDRNPTTSSDEYDIDELWLRWGPETAAGFLPDEAFGAYAKIGKFAKFERQNDRHLESYGLVSTAFNRAEDIGLEVGFDLWRRLYVKGSFTQGNPLFFRDVNALAGDNGTPTLATLDNPIPELGTGFPIFYNADIDLGEIDFENPQVGLGVGVRLGGDSAPWSLEFLAFAYDRDLADTVNIGGTFYGGDLDLLFGPLNAFPLPVTHGGKQEKGANLWFYMNRLSFFAQYVDQDLGGLPRQGLEAELAYTFELPYLGALGGRQVFSFIQPAIRYSEMDNDFTRDALNMFPAPTVNWDWEKLDIGLRMGLVDRLLDLTVEWNDNELTLDNGNTLSLDEFLATLRWTMDWGS
jgi:hypothetical protein